MLIDRRALSLAVLPAILGICLAAAPAAAKDTGLIFVSNDRGLMPLFDRSIALTEINTIRLAPTL